MRAARGLVYESYDGNILSLQKELLRGNRRRLQNQNCLVSTNHFADLAHF